MTSSSFFLFFSVIFFSGAGYCRPSQVSTLLHLKNGFSDPTLLPSWTSTSDCCTWFGVSCTDDRTHVTSLDLSGLGLAFSVPFDFATLCNLTRLSSLNLSLNNFNSSIPPNLDCFPVLTHVNFSNSGFSGEIPPEFSRIHSLITLDLSITRLPQALALADPQSILLNLTNLRHLVLDGVDLSAADDWSRAIANSLPRLRTLSLSNCLISGRIHSSLSRLSDLTYLRLDGNNLSSPIPAFFSNFTSLTSLHLSSCNLIGGFPSTIFSIETLSSLDLSLNPKLKGHLPALRSTLQQLILSHTAFSGRLLASFPHNSSLTKLDLKEANFSGPVPVSLSNLTRLSYVDLSSNNFAGRFPSVAKIKQLSFLDLSSNGFSGPFPELSNELKLLARFNLRNNSFSGSIPSTVFCLPSLLTLQLGQNEFIGEITSNVDWASSNLRTVDLSENLLRGPIPKWLFQLRQLNVLSLSSNNFTGMIELAWLENLQNLTTLELSNNGLYVNVTYSNSSSFPQLSTLRLASCGITNLPEFLREQQILAYLDLSSNRISGQIPNWVWGIGNLISLNLSDNHFTGIEQPLDRISASSFSVLDLHSNRIVGPVPLPPNSSVIVDYSENRFNSTIPVNIGSYLPYAMFFTLSNNRLIGEIPTSICNASFLRVLDFSRNNLNGTIPQCVVSGMTSALSVLNFRANQISGVIPDAFPRGCSLRTIDFNGNQLRGPVPKTLSNCQMLEVINMGYNMIEDSFPHWMGNISNLRVLVLRSNGFFGQIDHPSAVTFKQLQIIDLSSNRFNGSIPQNCFRNWGGMIGNAVDSNTQVIPFIQSRILPFTPLYYQDTVMITNKGLNMDLVKILSVFTSLDLSNNNFEGPIPFVIGSLTMLRVLNLSWNALAGPIPVSLGNLSKLESVDLSHNRLLGEIPQQLTKLHFLAFLNLSHNRLVGKIPEGGQFDTFTYTSYKDNLALCGRPLGGQCSATALSEKKNLLSSSTNKLEGMFILIGIGYGTGVGFVMAPFLFWKKGRKWYNRYVDSLLGVIIPIPYHCEGERIEAEEIVDMDHIVELFDGEDTMHEGVFCIFCTKLDKTGTRIVHMDCSCDLSPPFES